MNLPEGTVMLIAMSSCAMRRSHVVGPDPSPDHMRFPGSNLGSVLERGATVRRPAHLPDSSATLHAFDAQSRIELLSRDTGNEELQCGKEKPPLVDAQRSPVPKEPGQLLVRRHLLRRAALRGSLKIRDELFGRLPGSSWNFDGDPTGIVMVRR